MELSIKEDRTNALLDRREIMFEIKSAVTPPRAEVARELVRKTMADENMIVIQRLSQKYGEAMVDGYAKIYKSADTLKKIEGQYLLERGKPKKKGEASGDKKEGGGEKKEGGEGKKETAGAEEVPKKEEKPNDKKEVKSG